MIKKNILRILITFSLSSFICLWILQESSHVQRRVIGSLIHFMEEEWDAQVTSQASKINIFTRTVYMTGGKVVPRNRKCSWSFGSGKVSISLWDLLFKRSISLSLVFNDIVGTTALKDKRPELIDHLTDIFETEQTFLKIKPCAVTLHNAKLFLELESQQVEVIVAGALTLRKHKNNRGRPSEWAGSLMTDGGSVVVNKKIIVSRLKSRTIFSKNADADAWSIACDQRFILHTEVDEYACRLRNKGQNYFLTGPNKKIDLTILFQDPWRFKGILPRNVIEQIYYVLYGGTIPKKKTHELITFNFLLKKPDDQFHLYGKASVKNHAFIPEFLLNDIIVTPQKASASLVADVKRKVVVEGKALYDFASQSGSIDLWNSTVITANKNESSWSLGSWFVKRGGARLSLMIDKDFGVSGRSLISSINRLSQEEKTAMLNIYHQKNELLINGTIDSNPLEARLLLSPHPHISYFSYKGKKNKDFVHLLASPRRPLKLTGIVSYPFLQSFLPYDVQHLVLGRTGQFAVAVDQTNVKSVTGSIELKTGSLYMPESHNLIEKGHINFMVLPEEKSVHLLDCVLNFHKGFIKCPRASFGFSDDLSFSTMHCPLEINDLFLNWKRDLYAFVYGNMQVSKKSGMPLHIGGNLVLKKSFLKDGLFPEATSDKLYLPTLSSTPLSQEVFSIALDVATEKPMKIKTKTLDALARISLNIRHTHKKNEFNAPRITGTVTLDQGQLKFLQHTLFIEHGRVQFLTQQLNDPIIELTAKNRINKYLITLYATGSLQKPNIILESIPELTEEQILNVLLSGSQETTLQKDLPAILLQNLNVILMGNKGLPQKANSWLTRLARPFKYIQITPDFTDQSGRGGIKGIISVDITKQLHAQFQKNFNLQEDFAFHIGYVLSDDVNVKAIKDQRGELGAELEVRFKL